MADRIQLRRDTAANWTAYNPILLEGEPGIEIDTDQWKLGDGVHTWSQLAYRGGECVQQRGQSTTVAMSQKAVTDELNLIGVFDISAHNLTDGQPTKYADLTAALGTNGANVPKQYRVPGMTIRYVQSSDNKYVQFRYMSSSTAVADFTNVSNWQGVDAAPKLFSKNLVESDGVFNTLNKVYISEGKYINSYGNLNSNANWFVAEFELDTPIAEGDEIVWSGLITSYDACLVWYQGTTRKGSLAAANTDPRTGTVDSSSVLIGSDYIKASFAMSKKASAGITINGIAIPMKVINKFDEQKEYTDENINALDLEDATSAGNQAIQVDLALKKDSTTLDTLTIGSATDNKAGLMPAKSTWDNVPTKNSNKPISSGAVAESQIPFTGALGGDVEIDDSEFKSGYFAGIAYGSVVSNRTTSSSYKSMKLSCQEGDELTITGEFAYNLGLTYAFIDENGHVLRGCNQYTVTYTNKKEIAPADTAYFVFNVKANDATRKVLVKYAGNIVYEKTRLDGLYDFTGYTKLSLNGIFGGIFDVPAVGSIIDLTNDVITDAANARSVIDCKEDDIFYITTRSAAIVNATAFAILDADNKVILRSARSASLSSLAIYDNARVIIPSGGVKLIVNHQLRGSYSVYRSDEGSVNYVAVITNDKYGFHHVHIKTSTESGIKYVIGSADVPYYQCRNKKLKVVVRTTDTAFVLNKIYNNGTIRPLSLPVGETDYSNKTLEILGINICLSPTSPLRDVELDMDIYMNDAYDNKYLLLDKPEESAEGNIPIFTEDGEIEDSGFNINNLPHGSELPSGGYNGEVLKTDGNGNYYWEAVPTTTTTDVSQTFGVLVDQYENLNVGVSWVNAIRKAIEVAGEGGTIVFTPDKTYVIDSTISMLKGQTIIGNNATLKRANKSEAVLAANSSSAVITVDSVPSDWTVGDRLFIHTGVSEADNIGYRKIVSISGTSITLDSSITASSGAYVTKSFIMLSGSQYPNPVFFKVFNLVFDGNKANNDSLYYWYFGGTIHNYGFGGIISGCKFIDIPTENIICQGTVIDNCYAENLNGSFVHLSCPATNLITDGKSYMGCSITNNIVKGSNMIDPAITGHSSCVIEQSWNPGKLIVQGNQFYSGGYGQCFTIGHLTRDTETPTTNDQGGYVIIANNIFDGYTAICAAIYDGWTVNNKMMVNNIFRNCGTTDMTKLYNVDIFVEQNLLVGNTVINKGGNTLMYRVDTDISAVPTASDLTTKYAKLPVGGEVYITRIDKLYKKIKTSNSTVVWLDESVSVLS